MCFQSCVIFTRHAMNGSCRRGVTCFDVLMYNIYHLKCDEQGFCNHGFRIIILINSFLKILILPLSSLLFFFYYISYFQFIDTLNTNCKHHDILLT